MSDVCLCCFGDPLGFVMEAPVSCGEGRLGEHKALHVMWAALSRQPEHTGSCVDVEVRTARFGVNVLCTPMCCRRFDSQDPLPLPICGCDF